jgi:hypothetical protein
MEDGKRKKEKEKNVGQGFSLAFIEISNPTLPST